MCDNGIVREVCLEESVVEKLSPLSRRDQIAAMAMQGLLASAENFKFGDGLKWDEDMAFGAVQLADALIAKLDETAKDGE